MSIEEREYPDDGQNWLFDIVVRDVEKSVQALKANDALYDRRTVIRATFAAMEGLTWHAKECVLTQAQLHPTIYGLADVACLREENYFVSENGKTQVRSAYVPITTTIKLLVRLLDRNPAVSHKINLQDAGFVSLRSTLALRHRLTHPKRMHDLHVTKGEVEETLRAFHWVLAFTLRTSAAVRDVMKLRASAMRPE